MKYPRALTCATAASARNPAINNIPTPEVEKSAIMRDAKSAKGKPLKGWGFARQGPVCASVFFVYLPPDLELALFHVYGAGGTKNPSGPGTDHWDHNHMT